MQARGSTDSDYLVYLILIKYLIIPHNKGPVRQEWGIEKSSPSPSPSGLSASSFSWFSAISRTRKCAGQGEQSSQPRSVGWLLRLHSLHKWQYEHHMSGMNEWSQTCLNRPRRRQVAIVNQSFCIITEIILPGPQGNLCSYTSRHTLSASHNLGRLNKEIRSLIFLHSPKSKYLAF